MQERMVARKIDIKTLYTGQYIIQEGFNPNYIEINGERISRVRVLGTVIDKFLSEDGNYGTITLDDGTDTIRAKAFQDLRIIEPIEKGDVVEMIGKIREYNAERYLQPEIIVKVEDPNLEVLRKLEIKKIGISAKAQSEAAPETAAEETILPQEKQQARAEEVKEESVKEEVVAKEISTPAPVQELPPEEIPAKMPPEEAPAEEELPKEEAPPAEEKPKAAKKPKAKGPVEQKKLI